MKIIIPMSGIGKRFTDASYSIPKPLIQIEGKPMIEYVVSMFPGDHDFIFVCNEEHLKNTTMLDVLTKLRPNSKIVSVPVHNKGPVVSTAYILDEIKDTEEVIVSYCDYFMDWNFKDFLEKVKGKNFRGAVPAYTGFHPHLLRRELYGGILVEGGVMKDFMEKHSFTFNPEESHHSAGVYYFSDGATFKKYLQELLDSNVRHDGEAYISMMYYFYLRDGHKIYVPEVKKFMQWGTPTDFEEYEAWVRYFYKKMEKEKPHTDIPKEREAHIRIPYKETTENFKKSHDYWEEYFLKI